MKYAALCGLLFLAAPALAETDAAGRQSDIDYLTGQIAEHYAYLPERHLDLEKLGRLYRREAAAASTREEFLHVIEKLVGELHDHHATLGSNTAASPRLIPSGTEIWAAMEKGRAIIQQVRAGGPAGKAGLRAGDEVLSVNGIPVMEALAKTRPRSLAAPDPEADNYTLRQLLAGTHEGTRHLVLRRGHQTRAIRLAPYEPPQSPTLVTSRWLAPGIGYLRIENSLGDSETAAAFDAALKPLSQARALILDLRNTPSGGNSDVAEPILGRFIAKQSGYQRVFEPGKGKRFPADSWVKTVAPRLPTIRAKLFVLVDHWTGSMGEGMAIGLDGLARATVIGTPMAALCGGTASFTLPHSAIRVHFPVERLYHLDGTPREIWRPQILIDPAKPGDAILARALKEARRAKEEGFPGLTGRR